MRPLNHTCQWFTGLTMRNGERSLLLGNGTSKAGSMELAMFSWKKKQHSKAYLPSPSQTIHLSSNLDL